MRKFFQAFIFAAIFVVSFGALAGNIEGPLTRRNVVGSHATHSYWLAFNNKSEAIIIVEGDGSTDLDCYVFNSSGDVVESDTDKTDGCVLMWFPSRTEKYKLKIKNLGNIPNAYLLTTN
jgi:hypothetical protein